MSVLVWTGDHNKSSAERLRLMNSLAIDVPIDSKVYNALDLGRFPKNKAHTKYVVVPALDIFLAVGGAFHLYGDVAKPWTVTSSIPSVETIEHTLKNAYDKGFGVRPSRCCTSASLSPMPRRGATSPPPPVATTSHLVSS